MTSLIPEYTYDIFISYRQKDNKHDGWVTRFVENLRGELESTFKEDISIYFDENPHDRLQETHNVDKSLEGKLKCLIFIPILSQTYCDPNSYAWQYEFLAFLRMAENDRFGKDVRLRSDNVTSRILPVRIHDLEPEDVKLFEKETGSVLRAIDFIFKTATGVSRPLLYNEDHPNDNLNKTFYRDQINKLAHAIKEIIMGMKTEGDHVLKGKNQQKESIKETEKRRGGSDLEKLVKSARRRWFTVVGIVALLLVAAILAYPRIFRSRDTGRIKPGVEKSIAVLPFINDSPDEGNNYFINGIMDEVLKNLQSIRDLRVISRTSVERYRDASKPSLPEIARKLNVNYIVEGSGQKYGNTIRLRVQLIEALSDKHLWAESYEQEINETKDIFVIQSKIAQAIANELQTIITPQEKMAIEKVPTANMGAYDAFLKGLFFYEKNTDNTPDATYWFKEAIKLDSTFALPWTYLSMCYWRLTSYAKSPEFKECRWAAERALELDPASGIAIVNMAEILDNEREFRAAEEKIKQALKAEPDNPYVLRNAGRFYTLLGREEESISFCTKALQNDPDNPTALRYLTEAHYYAGNLSEARATYNKMYDLGSSWRNYQLLLKEGKFENIFKEPRFRSDMNDYNIAMAASYFAIGEKEKADSMCTILKKSDITPYWMAFIYAYSDDSHKVIEWLEKSYSRGEKYLNYVGVEPVFDKFRNEPGFKQLIQKMNFPVR